MAEAAPAPDFPRVFGRYLLLDRLSRGGMGEVYLARVGEIEGFQKPCVIKKILPALAADQNFIGRFVAEAQVAIKLQHANIAPVYEVGLVDADYFLALEFVDGRDLRRTVNRAREEGRHIPIEAGLFLVREVASGLAYAHRRVDESGKPLGLVHCDVSPPNILLGFEGEVKLIDFGIARSAAAAADADANVGFGKVGYMAPEQLGEFGNRVDKRTDIYAAGVVLFELLTGSRPFDFAPETSAADMARQIKEGAPHVSDRRPGLGKRFDELVGRALRFDPDERYPSAEELRDAVQRQLVEIAPTFSGERLGRYLRGLFADEMGDADPTIAARTADMKPFDKMLDEARSRTVSFALSSAWTSPPTGARPTPMVGLPGPPTPVSGVPVPMAVSAPIAAPARLRWTSWAGLGVALAALAGAGVMVMRSRAPQPQVISDLFPRLVPPDAAAAPQLAPIAAAPVKTPQPTPEPSPPAADPAPPAPPTPHAAGKVKRRPARVAHAVLTKEEVDRHFQSVNVRYKEFERLNGKRLYPKWQELQTYAATHAQELAANNKRLADFEKLLNNAMKTR